MNVTTTVHDRSRYSVYVNSHLILDNLDTHDFEDVPAFSDFFGNATVGLGPWADQAAYFRNLRLFDTDGATIYFNPMKGEDVFSEFGVAENEYE